MPTSPPWPRQPVRKSDSSSGLGMCGMTVLCSCTSTFFSRSEGRGSLSSPSQASLHESEDGGEMVSRLPFANVTRDGWWNRAK